MSEKPMPLLDADEDKIVPFIASRISTGHILKDLYASVSPHSQRRAGGGLYAATMDAHGYPFPPLITMYSLAALRHPIYSIKSLISLQCLM